MREHRNTASIGYEREQGFTIMEALISFSILVVALAAFTNSMLTTLEGFERAENSHLASKIAKEGIEMVMSKRSNHIECERTGCPELSEWRDGLEEGSYEISAARIEELLPGNDFFSYAGVREGRPLCFLDVASGSTVANKFGYCTGPPGQRDGSGDPIPGSFSRELKIEDLGDGEDSQNPDGIRVLSIVQWGDASDPHEITLEVLIYGQ